MNRLEAGMALAITMSAAVAMLLFMGCAAYGFFLMQGRFMVEIIVYALAVIGVVALPALFFWSATTFDIREVGKGHEKENK